VAGYLYSADVYVSATTIENFGTAVVEAGAHALPVLTTSVGFPSELVVEGETGCLVPPGDEEALRSALFNLVQNAETLSHAGWKMRQRVEEMRLAWPTLRRLV